MANIYVEEEKKRREKENEYKKKKNTERKTLKKLYSFLEGRKDPQQTDIYGIGCRAKTLELVEVGVARCTGFFETEINTFGRDRPCYISAKRNMAATVYTEVRKCYSTISKKERKKKKGKVK